MKHVLAVLFLAFVAVLILLADRGQLGYLSIIYSIPRGDKVVHFVLFGVLNFLVTRSVISSNRFQNRWLAAFATGLTLAVLMAIEEWSQRFFPGRTVSIKDLIAGYAGVLLGGIAALRFDPERKNKRSS